VDVLNVMDPLRNNLILGKLGATIMTGLHGNVQIPKYSGTGAFWPGETNCIGDSSGNWESINYSPIRITAVVPISKMWLLQESASAEAMIRRDIVKSLSEGIEKALLGDDAGSAGKPAGIADLIAPIPVTPTFQEIIALESAMQT
jgi:HK97 family phage major capsid protein